MSSLSDKRKCMISGKNMDEADLGICLYVHPRTKADMSANRLPMMDVLPNSLVSRIEFNKGIQNYENGVSDYIVRTKDGKKANQWFPLCLRMKEHWYRTAGARGTKQVSESVKKTISKKPPTNYYFVLDKSGSMAGGKINQCLISMQEMVKNTIQNHDFVSLITFNSKTSTVFPLLQKGKHENKINTEIAKSSYCSSMTRFYGSLEDVINTLDTSRPCVVIALTDGDDTCSGKNYQPLVNQLLKEKQRKSKINLMIITAGTLEQTTQNQIQKLAEVAPEGHVIKAGGNASDIKEAYQKVSRMIVSTSGGEDTDIVGTEDLLMSAFSLIVSGQNGEFSPEQIWRVSARLLNLCVVGFAKGETNINEETIQDYSDINRTLIEMLNTYPQIKKNLIDSLISFMDKTTPNNRRREIIPDLGEALQLLSIIDEIKWDDFKEVYIQEVLRRNARFLKKQNKVLSKKQASKMTEEEQVAHYWKHQKISMMIVAFNVLFLREIVHTNNRTIKEACQEYDKSLQYVDTIQLKEFMGKIDYLKDMDSYPELMKFLGFSSKYSDILDLIDYGLSYEQEPTKLEDLMKSTTIKPANNIRHTNVKSAKIDISDLDYSSYHDIKKTQVKSKKINHLGWEASYASMNVSDKAKLQKAVQNAKLKKEFYTAIMFDESQEDLHRKAVEIEGKTKTGTITGVYVDPTGVVSNLVVDGKTYKCVLTQPRQTKPHIMKENAENGYMGEVIPVDNANIMVVGKVFYK